ncbi:DMT family transporter [Nakamurella lactea]|uniref:DMT family transporter n=1 Tax=Nakamurella lactea TaxID=459515 RepID=UPI001B7FA1B9|nr:DMT family transporter [Nakamurella lactea]
MTSSRTSLLALVGLLAVAVTWGSSFPLTKVVLQQLSTPDFLAVRFVLATVVMLAIFHRAVRALPRTALLRGGALGLLYGSAQLLQTAGLERTPASVSGFITGLYVVLTPICAAVLLRAPIGRRVWIGAVLAAVGLGFLALNGSLTPGVGEMVTLASALLYALHIVGLSAWTRPEQALGLAVVQIAGTAVVSLAFAVPDGIELPHTPGVWLAVIYMALVSGAIAMIVQSWAQAHLAASRAAIIMSTEPLWATVFSVTFFDEPLTIRIVIGGATILAAMLVVELRPRAGPVDPNDPRPEDLPKLAA